MASGCAGAADPTGAKTPESSPVRIQRQRRDYIDPSLWDRADMRQALGTRDIPTVFRLLQRFGLSQRAISARVGMAQGEVCDVLKGRRRVTSYDVFVRIADGFGLPRGWLGVAYDDMTEAFVRQSAGQE